LSRSGAGEKAGKGQDRVRSLIEERIGVLLRRRRTACRSATPESIHDVRVATRRLQECLDLFAGALPGRPRERLRRRARRIRRELAEMRDTDVLLGLVRGLRVAAIGASRRPLDILEGRLAVRAESLRRDLARGGGPRIPIAGFRKRAQVLIDAMKPGARGAVDTTALRTVAARAGSVRWALRLARSGRAADLHRLRVAIKRYRYTLEVLEAWGLSMLKPEVESARRVQEALGAVHDMDVLIGWMRREAAPVPIVERAREERRGRARTVRAVLAGFRPVQLERSKEEDS
jgi:CHAD domain-containing protein